MNEKYGEAHQGVNGESAKVRRLLDTQSAEHKSKRGKQVEEGAEFRGGLLVAPACPSVFTVPSVTMLPGWDSAASEHDRRVGADNCPSINEEIGWTENVGYPRRSAVATASFCDVAMWP